MAYKRDQFPPSGRCEEMEFFITEWRWGQKVRRKISKGTLSSAHQNEVALHQKTGSSSAKPQLSCPVAPAQILWVLCGEQHAAVFLFFQASEDFQSEALMSFCPFSISGYLVFLSYVTFLGPFSWKSAEDNWKCLEHSKAWSSLSHTQIVIISVIPFECKSKYESLKCKKNQKNKLILQSNNDEKTE